MHTFVIALAIIASAFAIFLVGRELFCWYWKVNRIISLLESIDSKLKSKDTHINDDLDDIARKM